MKSILVIVHKKRFILCLSILVLMLITVPMIIVEVFFHNNILDGKIIVVDAGHGGVDGGTSNSHVFEKEINLDVALKLQRKLEKSGVSVIMTRTSDVELSGYDRIDRTRYRRDLKARLDIINSSSADLFISIHTNSHIDSPSTRGAIAFFYNSHPHNRDMAYIFQSIFNSYGFIYNGKEYTSSHIPQVGKYYLLVNAKIPGIIVETGFITNSTDIVLLKKAEYREYMADAIYKGIESYLICRDDLTDIIKEVPESREENVIKMIEELENYQ